MCTVSWIHDKDGYELLCNRDEKLTRKSAQMPRLSVHNGTRFLAPVDGDFGGTWIATNEFGTSLCLLNGANLSGVEASPPTKFESRGLLIPQLVDVDSIDAARRRLARADLSVFAAFTLVVLEPRQPTAIFEWNGVAQRLALGEDVPLTSSSF